MTMMRCTCISMVGMMIIFGGLAGAVEPIRPVPVIHCTDLFHPHDDFDDVLDLMAIVGLHRRGDIDLRKIILDQPEVQAERPGSVLVERLNAITGEDIPSGMGPESILSALRESDEPVVITIVGSLTDLFEAYQADPALCREMIRAVWVFAGDAQADPSRDHRDGTDWFESGLEYNVALNPEAFIGVMRSELPIVWIPCYDGGLVHEHQDGIDMVHGSYHMGQYEQLFEQASPAVREFFIEALSSERPEGGLYEWETVKEHWKSLFGVGIFQAIARPDEDYPFEFIEEHITVHDNATISRGEGRSVHLFKRTDQLGFYDRMTALTVELIGAIDPAD